MLLNWPLDTRGSQGTPPECEGDAHLSYTQLERVRFLLGVPCRHSQVARRRSHKPETVGSNPPVCTRRARMKYRIENEFGEIVARVNDPVDTAHIYTVLGPGHKVFASYNKLVYPRSCDNPGMDTHSYMGARIIERTVAPTPRKSAKKPAGSTRTPELALTVNGKYKRYGVGKSWKDLKEQGFKANMEATRSEAS